MTDPRLPVIGEDQQLVRLAPVLPGLLYMESLIERIIKQEPLSANEHQLLAQALTFAQAEESPADRTEAIR